jgi:hypothetical protein
VDKEDVDDGEQDGGEKLLMMESKMEEENCW